MFYTLSENIDLDGDVTYLDRAIFKNMLVWGTPRKFARMTIQYVTKVSRSTMKWKSKITQCSFWQYSTLNFTR